MPRSLIRPFRRVGGGVPLTRRGLRGTAVATAATVAVALLTAGSQAPEPGRAAPAAEDEGMSVPGGFVARDTPLADVPSQGDDSYHVELPPLKGVSGVRKVRAKKAVEPSTEPVAAEAGLPAGVFTAYRKAAQTVGRTDPGCGLRWELLAAIGKVESGHAGGGAVTADGDTVNRITGPALDGHGFALILDSEGGTWDGDAVYDRAVGPLQFLPTTWKTWGADGNGDGVANPNNVFDAALAAGHYLCAGRRDLGTAAGLERAILSYNYSRDYLNLVLGWMTFYLRGVHTVPDGTGVVPRSPGAGSDTPATKPVQQDEAGGGDTRDDSTPGGDITPSPRPVAPTRPASPKPSPSESSLPPAGPSPTPDPDPTAEPTPGGTPYETPGGTPSDPAPAPDPAPADSPAPSPTETTTPAPEPSTEAPASPTPTPTAADTPEADPSDTAVAASETVGTPAG